jgi:hypothetical protein
MLIKLSVDLLLDYEILPPIELSPVLSPLRNGDTFGCCELSFTNVGLVDESISRTCLCRAMIDSAVSGSVVLLPMIRKIV